MPKAAQPAPMATAFSEYHSGADPATANHRHPHAGTWMRRGPDTRKKTSPIHLD